MDRDFMCFFYRNILPERTEVAVQGLGEALYLQGAEDREHMLQ